MGACPTRGTGRGQAEVGVAVGGPDLRRRDHVSVVVVRMRGRTLGGEESWGGAVNCQLTVNSVAGPVKWV